MSSISHSKNFVTGHIDAQGNVVVGDTIINLKEAAQYKAIEAEIAELNTRFERTRRRIEKAPDDLDFQAELLEIDAKRSQRQQELDTLKREVLKLAEDFQRIPLNTERLRKAKQHFDAGEFAEARAVLDAEAMGRELDELEVQEKKYEAKIDEIKQHKADKANEYLILARLTATDYELPDWYEKTIAYFEQSLRAVRNAENVFAYAEFLHHNNQFSKSYPLYKETLQLYRGLAEVDLVLHMPNVAMTLNGIANLQLAINELEEALIKYEEALQLYRALSEYYPFIYLPVKASVLNNLAVLYQSKNEFKLAQDKYEQSLLIYRNLANENLKEYMPYVAMTLNNLAVLNSALKEYDLAIVKCEEALQIYSSLAEEHSQVYMPFVAMTLNNWGEFCRSQKKFSQAKPLFQKSLQIYRSLAIKNPYMNLSDVAMTLNNLALAQKAVNEFEEALAKYQEALQIYRVLAKENPQAYLPKIAMTAVNLAIFYLQSVPDREKSLAYGREAIRAGHPFADYLPSVQSYMQATMQVVTAWNEAPETFLQNTLTQMNEQPSPLQNTA